MYTKDNQNLKFHKVIYLALFQKYISYEELYSHLLSDVYSWNKLQCFDVFKSSFKLIGNPTRKDNFTLNNWVIKSWDVLNFNM